MLNSMRASEIAALERAELIGEDMVVKGVCTLNRPTAHCIGFAKQLAEHQLEALSHLSDLVLFVTEDMVGRLRCAHIPVSNPRLSFARTIAKMQSSHPTGIASSAVVHPSAKLGPGVMIGSNVHIGENSQIGSRTIIHPNTVIGSSVRIGNDCIIKSCSVIGQDGFGIVQDENGKNIRLPHIGGVKIADFVEVGALNTICSGTIEPTQINEYVKIDDHVHIAHNVNIAENVIITACTEISGSVKIGARSWLGPNCSILNGLELGFGVFVGLGAVVTKSLPERAVVAGSPARIIRIAEKAPF